MEKVEKEFSLLPVAEVLAKILKSLKVNKNKS